jgi:hypothetical protein
MGGLNCGLQVISKGEISSQRRELECLTWATFKILLSTPELESNMKMAKHHLDY